jgi:DNA-binding NtrC family response regulator
MQNISNSFFFDLASLWIENPYATPIRPRSKILVRKLLEKPVAPGEEREFWIVENMMSISAQLADVCATAAKDVAWETEKEFAVMVVGALRYACETGWLADDFHVEAFSRRIPQPVSRRLKQKQWNLLGVIAAANRCERHLNRELRGNAPSLIKVKEKVWSAAFGANLAVAMIHSDLIRKQNVLVYGASGSGKEEVARALIEGSFQDNMEDTGVRPSSSVNVAAIQPTLIESELFGHVQGAFTGASKNKTGFVEKANRGTFFLDEIGELPKDLQAKFLRVMETGLLQRVGSTSSIQVDVRYVAATHRDLQSMIQDNAFRLDFFYRLCGIWIDIPPLKDILQEDPQSLKYLIEKFVPEEKKTEIGMAAEIIAEQYGDYAWPGNVRELRNLVYEYILRGGVHRKAFRKAASIVREAPSSAASQPSVDIPQGIIEVLWKEKQVMDWYRDRALNRYPSTEAAAKILGRSVKTLFRFTQNDQADEKG